MNDESNNILWIFPLIGAFLIWEYGSFPFSDEVTIHPEIQVCTDKKEKSKCEKVNAKRLTFTIFPNTQTVVQRDTSTGENIRRLKLCTIANKNNWRCSITIIEYGVARTKYDLIGFYDGEFRTTDKDVKIINKPLWWLTHLIQIIKN